MTDEEKSGEGITGTEVTLGVVPQGGQGADLPEGQGADPQEGHVAAPSEDREAETDTTIDTENEDTETIVETEKEEAEKENVSEDEGQAGVPTGHQHPQTITFTQVQMEKQTKFWNKNLERNYWHLSTSRNPELVDYCGR
mmetsp:Transcript_6779/g.9364  ORF Transcript_6779/g.9364 Transcript_6779/m.9364 type:complete len:140 (+) Transcript_6779:589-1008(+)